MGVKLVAPFTLLGNRHSRPIGLEQRAGNVSDAQMMFVENLLRVLDLLLAEVGYVLVPHGTQLDPLQAKIASDDRTCPLKILGDFVVDDGQPERARAAIALPESVTCGRSRQECEARDQSGRAQTGEHCPPRVCHVLPPPKSICLHHSTMMCSRFMVADGRPYRRSEAC